MISEKESVLNPVDLSDCFSFASMKSDLGITYDRDTLSSTVVYGPAGGTTNEGHL